MDTPGSFAELFDGYFDFIKLLAGRAGIHPDDIEDVAQEILIKLYEKDYLGKFDEPCWCSGRPSVSDDRTVERMDEYIKVECDRCGGRVFITSSGVRRSKFKGFLAGVVKKYLLHYRTKQQKAGQREPVRLEEPCSLPGSGGELWVEVVTLVEEDPSVVVDAQVDYERTVSAMQAHLREVPVRGRRDLGRLLDLVVMQVATEGRVSRRDLALEFGVSDTAVGLMMKDLRQELDSSGLVPQLV